MPPQSFTFQTIDPASSDPRDLYRLLIGGIVPRPIAWVSTCDASGRGNLAPFSFYNGVSSRPPALSLSITFKKGGAKKDTLRNIEATRQFVVNSSSCWSAEAINASSGDFAPEVDEAQQLGLTTIPSVRVRPPRVAECAVQFECELLQTVQIGAAEEGGSTLVVGRIVFAHVAREVLKDGRIELAKLDPLARLGGLDYGVTREVFSLERP